MKDENKEIADAKKISMPATKICQWCAFADNCPRDLQYEPIARVIGHKFNDIYLRVACYHPMY